MPRKKAARSHLRSTAASIAAEINSSLGKPVVTLASDPDLSVVKIPTPSLTINRVTGGGFVVGRHVEISGDPSAGKSSIAYGTMALSQQRGNICGVVDPEGVFDFTWFEHLGGRPDELLYHRPDDAEQFLSVARLLVERSLDGEPIEVLMVDSISALVTREQVEKDPREEERVASQARYMSRALRLLTTRNRRILIIWINQEREKPGVMFGNRNTTSGGRALGFYATTRLEMRKTGQVTKKKKYAEKGKLVDKEMKSGDWIQVRATKEKAAKPYMQGAFIFDNDKGRIDPASEIIQLGLEDGLIDSVGNRYVYTDLDGQEWKGGLKDWRKFISNEPELYEELASAIADQTHELTRFDDE